MELRNDIFALLEAEGNEARQLVELIHLIDARSRSLVMGGATCGGESDHPEQQLVEAFIARACVALGPPLAAAVKQNSIKETADAASSYVHAPSANAWSHLVRSATASYGFGPGDGCLALAELGGHGAHGSGCFSGVGFLHSTAMTLGTEEVMRVLRDELLPWLR